MSPLRSTWQEYREAAGAFSRPARLYLLCEFLAWTGYGIFQVLFNLYLVQGGHDPAFVGRTVSLTALGLALAALPAGVLADRWGRRRCLVLGALLDGDTQAGDSATLIAALGDAVPVTMVWGREDRVIPAAQAESVAGAVRHLIDRVGHMPHMERPAEVQAAIEETIARAT